MTENNVLAQVDRATQCLAEVRTIEEAVHLMALADAAKAYARQLHLGTETINQVTEAKLRFERRLGEMLRETPKNEGSKGAGPGRGVKGPIRQEVPFNDEPPKLSDLGISYKQSSRAQELADLPEKDFENALAKARMKSGEVSTAAVMREVGTGQRVEVHAARAARQFATGTYGVIYADPPWQYRNSGVITDDDNYGRAERHYPTLSIEELCALPVPTIAAPDAALFLWVTSPLLEECFAVIRAWGFAYKTSFVWDKVRHNFGHYNSVRHEFLLVCTRGSYTPEAKTLVDSVVTVERTDSHSEKPEQFRQIIETLYPSARRIELFARRQVDGWDAWGNEP